LKNVRLTHQERTTCHADPSYGGEASAFGFLVLLGADEEHLSEAEGKGTPHRQRFLQALVTTAERRHKVVDKSRFHDTLEIG
jgi:hypothetical protein